MKLTEQYLQFRNDRVLERLKKADEFWYKLRTNQLEIPKIVENHPSKITDWDSDIIICGGTLGIILGAALQKLGWKVILIERGILKGRAQEWNISRDELNTLIELELLTEIELEKAIATEYNPARIGFLGGKNIWVKDVLNIGVDPVYLLETLKNKFLESGGVLLENTAFKNATVYENGIMVSTADNNFKSRLLLDAMGHFSPIVKQARGGVKPDAICMVVGSCAEGYEKNDTGDLIYSFTPIINQCQYFWEAFPARDGRTTYMFSYLDAHRDRPTLEYFMEEYLRLLPEYQNIELEKLDFNRFLFGFFPAYNKSPLHLPFDRILPVGDSSGSQSPVSFGGFGSMIRHLKRLSDGINEALKIDSVTKKDLALLQPYQPNISVTWLFQKTMSVPIEQKVNPNQINNLMNGVFQVMEKLSDDVLKPFLQDVIQFMPLAKTLPLVNPKFVLPLIPQIGINPLVNWSIHYFNLALYNILYNVANSTKSIVKQLSPQQQYYYRRYLDAWKYGSGKDY